MTPLPAHPVVAEATEEDKAAAQVALDHLRRRAKWSTSWAHLRSHRDLVTLSVNVPEVGLDLGAVEYAAKLIRGPRPWRER